MEEEKVKDELQSNKTYLTSYYRKYYLANREKLLARSKERYANAKLKSTPLESVVKPDARRANQNEVKEAEDIFVIDDIDDLFSKSDARRANQNEVNQSEAEVPNKTTIEKLKELFSTLKNI